MKDERVITECEVLIPYEKGKIHREGAPDAIYPDGTKAWYKDRKLHREDGPAVIYPDGSKQWFKNGRLHREDGPAVIWKGGDEVYYINGLRLTKDQWWERLSDEKKLNTLFNG